MRPGHEVDPVSLTSELSWARGWAGSRGRGGTSPARRIAVGGEEAPEVPQESDRGTEQVI